MGWKFQWFLWPWLGSHKPSLLLFSLVSETSLVNIQETRKCVKFIRDHFGHWLPQSCIHNMFLPPALCFGSTLPSSVVMPLLYFTETYPLNSPALRFTKVGRWPTHRQSAVTPSIFVPSWKHTNSKDHPSKSSNEYIEDALYISVALLVSALFTS